MIGPHKQKTHSFPDEEFVSGIREPGADIGLGRGPPLRVGHLISPRHTHRPASAAAEQPPAGAFGPPSSWLGVRGPSADPSTDPQFVIRVPGCEESWGVLSFFSRMKPLFPQKPGLSWLKDEQARTPRRRQHARHGCPGPWGLPTRPRAGRPGGVYTHHDLPMKSG